MDYQLKKEIETRRQQLAVKSMYFNRFLFVRYMTAIFFFAFLNWSLAMWLVGTLWALVPVALFALAAVAAYEQIKIYQVHIEDAPLTTFSFRAIACALVLLLPALFSPLYSALFPFLNTLPSTLQAVTLLVIFANLVAFAVLRKLHNIRNRKDKQLARIQAMQSAFN